MRGTSTDMTEPHWQKKMKLKFQVLSKPYLTLLKQTSQEDSFIIFLLTTSYIIYVELQVISASIN
jgi:hypothetical protein